MDDELDKNGNVIGISDEERKKRAAVIKSRSMDGLTDKWRQEDRKVVEQSKRLIAPPVKHEPRCVTCQSDHRVYIERQLLLGHSYQSISNSIPNGPSRKSIANHFDEHMALGDAAIRAELNFEAEALGQNIEEGFRGAFTLRGALGVLLRKGYEDALNGVTTVEPKDLIQMGKLYNDLNEDSGTAAVEEAKLVISVFKEAIQNVLIKGDLIERPLGLELLQSISDEVAVLRQEQQVDKEFERNLLPVGNATSQRQSNPTD